MQGSKHFHEDNKRVTRLQMHWLIVYEAHTSFEQFCHTPAHFKDRQTESHKMSHLMTKPTKLHVRPAKTQISLGICPVWSESLLCAQWVAKGPSFLHVDREHSDQTWSLCWAHMALCWFCHAAAQMDIWWSFRDNFPCFSIKSLREF